MSRLVHANSFRNLIVYQKSRMMSREVFTLTKGFPKAELFCNPEALSVREEQAPYFTTTDD